MEYVWLTFTSLPVKWQQREPEVILWCLGIFIFVFISSLLIFFLSGTNTKALQQYTLPGKVAEVPWSKEMSLQVKIMKHLRDITNKKRKKQIELYIPTEVE